MGCDYYATSLDGLEELTGTTPIPPVCFAAFVANTWSSPAHVSVKYRGSELPVAAFARIPTGMGPMLAYDNYDSVQGIPPGQVAVLFLTGRSEGSGENEVGIPCPVPSAVPDAALDGTGLADSFHITTDVPVVAYQMKPYGGGRAAMTGASLLLPTSVWGTEYVAVEVAPEASGPPSMNVIARDDGTVLTLTPTAAVESAPGVSGVGAGQSLQIQLDAGQHVQITQPADLTGSVVVATKPVGVMAAQVCMNVPVGYDACDHGEQMIPPVQALGSRYAGVMYRPRIPSETSTYWRLVGVVDGTHLTYSTEVNGPVTLGRGESAVFQTGSPFEVQSQDPEHPFMLFTYMTGSTFIGAADGNGDPDFVLDVPTDQYLRDYVFFTDPTYPETNLVIVRRRGADGAFKDVTLDCAGALDGWQSITNDLEYTRHDLVTGNFMPVGACSTGVHRIYSDAPFGITVWGWGTLTARTPNVSYGFPGGMDVRPINPVVLLRDW